MPRVPVRAGPAWVLFFTHRDHGARVPEGGGGNTPQDAADHCWPPTRAGAGFRSQPP